MSITNCEPSKATGITVLQDPAHLQRKHSHKLKSAIPGFGKKREKHCKTQALMAFILFNKGQMIYPL